MNKTIQLTFVGGDWESQKKKASAKWKWNFQADRQMEIEIMDSRLKRWKHERTLWHWWGEWSKLCSNANSSRDLNSWKLSKLIRAASFDFHSFKFFPCTSSRRSALFSSHCARCQLKEEDVRNSRCAVFISQGVSSTMLCVRNWLICLVENLRCDIIID